MSSPYNLDLLSGTQEFMKLCGQLDHSPKRRHWDDEVGGVTVADLTNPDDPVVVDAVSRPCRLCRKPSNVYCSTDPVFPMAAGKLVHNVRVDPRSLP